MSVSLFALPREWNWPGPCLACPALTWPAPPVATISAALAQLADRDRGAMLSGSWRRSAGHPQSAASPPAPSRGMTVCGVPSGTVVLEAQYDYNYRGSDGRQVSIREGERFILLKKTNDDWWQVRAQLVFFLFLEHLSRILLFIKHFILIFFYICGQTVVQHN